MASKNRMSRRLPASAIPDHAVGSRSGSTSFPPANDMVLSWSVLIVHRIADYRAYFSKIRQRTRGSLASPISGDIPEAGQIKFLMISDISSIIDRTRYMALIDVPIFIAYLF
jgi:hypothetical protein